MIAVTFALPAESRDFVQKLRGTRASGHTVAGSCGSNPVEVVYTGVGGGVAGPRVRKYLDQARPNLLVAAGFGGATTDRQAVGDLILASNYSDPAFLQRAEAALAGLNPQIGKLYTALEVVDSARARLELWQREQAAVVDMESATIAAACQERGIPMLSLRVISDTPRSPFPLPAHVLFDIPRQRTVARRLVSYLVAHPTSMIRLIRFSRRISGVRARLATALEKLLENQP